MLLVRQWRCHRCGNEAPSLTNDARDCPDCGFPRKFLGYDHR